MAETVQAVARQVLEAVPVVMRTIRGQFRSYRRADISVPQFRTMSYIDRNEGASLSELASHIGLTLPSMSKLIDGLVSRKLVTRSSDALDRRRICLALTPLGREELQEAHRSTEQYLANQLATLSAADREAVSRAMQTLKDLFAPELQAPSEPHSEK